MVPWLDLVLGFNMLRKRDFRAHAAQTGMKPGFELDAQLGGRSKDTQMVGRADILLEKPRSLQ